MTVEAFRKIYPSEFFERFIEASVRPDGRNLLGVRQTLVSVGSISSADGSAFVKLSTGVAPNSPACASTSVLAGVTAEVGYVLSFCSYSCSCSYSLKQSPSNA